MRVPRLEVVIIMITRKEKDKKKELSQTLEVLFVHVMLSKDISSCNPFGNKFSARRISRVSFHSLKLESARVNFPFYFPFLRPPERSMRRRIGANSLANTGSRFLKARQYLVLPQTHRSEEVELIDGG